jgi:NADPH:quinone reductase-like Zn-dependent oxidoreductase
MKTHSMKAMVATGYGSPEVLQLQTVKKPEPKDNEVLVEVHAASATTADGMMRTGKPYLARLFTGIRTPKQPIPGTGFAGIIRAIGKNVSSFQIGDKVFGETTLGFSTNAEYVAVPENGVILPLPEYLSFYEAASICDGHLTSYNFLTSVALVKKGQKVLINGAAGALGTAAVQIANHLGAEVTAVCSTRNVGLVKSLGADFVVDYSKQDFTTTRKKYDVIFDTVGKSSFRKAQNALTETGEYISPVLQFPLLIQTLKTSGSKGKKAKFAATGMKKDNELREMLGHVLEIIQAGKLKTVIDRQYPLEKLAEAHTYIATGHKKGNVVIAVR